MKIPSLGDELFHADRRTDKTKLIFAFRKFANAPETLYATLEVAFESGISYSTSLLRGFHQALQPNDRRLCVIQTGSLPSKKSVESPHSLAFYPLTFSCKVVK